MSANALTPEDSPQSFTTPTSRFQQSAKPKRVLACQLCQQRKVKCDRKLPCSNCTRHGAPCVSASLLPRQRRRRFPERELLERIRLYEDLLQKNNISFEPLHPTTTNESYTPHGESAQSSPKQVHDILQLSSLLKDSEPPRADEQGTVKNFWDAMNRKPRLEDGNRDELQNEDDPAWEGSDDSSYLLREREIKRVWDSVKFGNDHLLFCGRNTSVDLFSLHPSQIQIFQLWQIYLENVDPLLKVTHTPTLQPQIIKALSDLKNIGPTLEAFLFSLYCISVFSMTQDDCTKQFGSSRSDLLGRYQLGAREALLNIDILKCSDRSCLTALHLYLITTKPGTDPRSLSSILGVAIRIAQRLGIHDETTNKRHPILEAELRRRLWWSLVLFDARITEMASFKNGLLLPTWDCKPPMNANDFDLRPESKKPPSAQTTASEAFFSAVRGETGDFVRFADFHLDFINPALKAIKRRSQSSPAVDEIDAFEQSLEERYIRYCDQENPLHFMTMWWARSQAAKCRFVRSLSRSSDLANLRSNTQPDEGFSNALEMLECDTNVMTSNLVKRYRWLIYLHFPFPAYVHILQDLRKQPLAEYATQAWKVMDENCSARFGDIDGKDKVGERYNPFFKLFAGVIMAAWAAREAEAAQFGAMEPPPSLVLQVKSRLERYALWEREEGHSQYASVGTGGTNNVDLVVPRPDETDSVYCVGDADLVSAGLDPFSFLHMQAPVDVNHWGWPEADWNTIGQNW